MHYFDRHQVGFLKSNRRARFVSLQQGTISGYQDGNPHQGSLGQDFAVVFLLAGQ